MSYKVKRLNLSNTVAPSNNDTPSAKSFSPY